MGQYLSAPVTEKESQQGQSEALAFGLSAMQGWRVSMEDAHISELALDGTPTALFSVFDGHGGKAVAKFCAKHMSRELVALESYRRGDLGAALAEAYYRMDVLLDTEEGKAELNALIAAPAAPGSQGLFSDVEGQLDLEPGSDAPSSPKLAAPTPQESPAKPSKLKRIESSEEFRRTALARDSIVPASPAAQNGEGGAAAAAPDAAAAAGGGSSEEEEEPHRASGTGCTAVSVLVRGDEVTVANTGDSRCVLSRRGEAHPLSIDHKPILYDEAQRIIRAGGFVRDNRINGALNVSRTIGDLDFKRNAELPHTEQMVVATPDVERVALQGGDEFLILACDGIWDVLTNQEAVDFVRRRLKQRLPLQAICEAMCDRCLATDLKGACRGADNMSVIVVVFRRHADLGSVWGRLAGLFRRRTA